jgi:hypothetical protein
MGDGVLAPRSNLDHLFMRWDERYCQSSVLREPGKIGYTYGLFCTSVAMADADNVLWTGKSRGIRASPAG